MTTAVHKALAIAALLAFTHVVWDSPSAQTNAGARAIIAVVAAYLVLRIVTHLPRTRSARAR